MARKPRLNLPGIPLHIVQRGNNRDACIFSEYDYTRYLEDLTIAAQKSSCDIHAYVLMTSHVHLLVTSHGNDCASLMMQSIGRRYVRYVNGTYQRVMNMKILSIAMLLAVTSASAAEIEPVKEQEKARMLGGVSVLMNKADPRQFPAIIKVVSLPVPVDECEPSTVTEEECPQKNLYMTFSNWDIAADVHAFKIGTADAWRVGDLVLQEKQNQSFWTASLTLYAAHNQITEIIEIRIMNKADVYALELVRR